VPHFCVVTDCDPNDILADGTWIASMSGQTLIGRRDKNPPRIQRLVLDQALRMAYEEAGNFMN